MVGDKDYHPHNQSTRAAAIRQEKFDEVSALLLSEENTAEAGGLGEIEYWQFRYRLWLARRYNVSIQPTKQPTVQHSRRGAAQHCTALHCMAARDGRLVSQLDIHALFASLRTH